MYKYIQCPITVQADGAPFFKVMGKFSFLKSYHQWYIKPLLSAVILQFLKLCGELHVQATL